MKHIKFFSWVVRLWVRVIWAVLKMFIPKLFIHPVLTYHLFKEYVLYPSETYDIKLSDGSRIKRTIRVPNELMSWYFHGQFLKSPGAMFGYNVKMFIHLIDTVESEGVTITEINAHTQNKWWMREEIDVFDRALNTKMDRS